jgi:hypothetical protein
VLDQCSELKRGGGGDRSPCSGHNPTPPPHIEDCVCVDHKRTRQGGGKAGAESDRANGSPQHERHTQGGLESLDAAWPASAVAAQDCKGMHACVLVRLRCKLQATCHTHRR